MNLRKTVLSYLPDRLWPTVGYAALVAWGKVVYASPVLSGGVPHATLHVWSMLATALSAFCLASLAGWVSDRLNCMLSSLFLAALGAIGVGIVAADTALAPDPGGLAAVVGYIAVGVASGWLMSLCLAQMSSGGIRSAVLSLALATAAGCVLVPLAVSLPTGIALLLAIALPLVAAFAAVVSVSELNPFPAAQKADEPAEDFGRLGGDTSLIHSPGSSGWMRSAPFALLAIIAALFLVEGAVRTGGGLAGIGFSQTAEWAGFALCTVLATLVGAAVAWSAHKRGITAALTFALPAVALGTVAWASFSGVPGFAGHIVVSAGCQVAFILVWIVLISIAMTFGVPSLGVVALLVCARFVGVFLGQALSTSGMVGVETTAYASLVILVLVALSLANTREVLTVTKEAIEGAPVPALEDRVARLAKERGLTPRETEVLAMWARGHAGPHLMDELHITKNTLKTHLGHIYLKCGVDNREELITLLEGMV